MSNDDLQAARPQTLGDLVHGIDHGIEAHLAWNQRLLRCALLRESPGDELLRPDAHSVCLFGVWLSSHRPTLETLDEVLVGRIAQTHQSMHDAVRLICKQVLQGQAAAVADVQTYEQGQSELVALLNELREHVAEAETHRDLLTGLPLRHGLEYAFDLRHKDARRAETQLWLAMIDIDHFKSVNDDYGHAVGDVALQHVTRCLLGCLRETDALFRVGGEEFLGMFLARDLSDVESLAARVLDSVSAAPLRAASGLVLQLTVTVGLARVHADEDLASATERADRAMLRGKTRRRGTFVLAP